MGAVTWKMGVERGASPQLHREGPAEPQPQVEGSIRRPREGSLGWHNLTYINKLFSSERSHTCVYVCLCMCVYTHIHTHIAPASDKFGKISAVFPLLREY